MKSLKTSHTFQNITEWSHDLNKWVYLFKTIHGIYPTILLAADRTFTKIDMIANTNSRHKIKGASGNCPDRPVRMIGFQGANYELKFCVNESLEVNKINLIFEFDSGDDGEQFEKDSLAFFAIGINC
ncbi:MAG: hypothetical protein V4598_16550 [Bdellovibrionota bacterium]